MAGYTIVRSCGHKEEVNIAGKQDQRDSKVAFESSKSCYPCWKAQQNAERAKEVVGLAADAVAAGLPALTGSEKQISWAEKIRAERMPEIERVLERCKSVVAGQKHFEFMQKAIPFLESCKQEVSAKWWIDHREGTGTVGSWCEFLKG